MLKPLPQALQDSVLERMRSCRGSSVPFDVAGDWKRLIQYFTNYQGDYADGLITRLCAGRGPSLGHQALAFPLPGWWGPS